MLDLLNQWPHEFYILKGVIAVVATVLYLIHMDVVWAEVAKKDRYRFLGMNDQQWRYLALMVGGCIVTFASAEQVHDEAVVNWRNLGGMLFAIVLFVAAVVSLIAHYRSKES